MPVRTIGRNIYRIHLFDTRVVNRRQAKKFLRFRPFCAEPAEKNPSRPIPYHPLPPRPQEPFQGLANPLVLDAAQGFGG